MMGMVQAEHPWAEVSEQEGILFCMCRCCSKVVEQKRRPQQPAFGMAPGVQLKTDLASIEKQLRGHARQDKHKKAAGAAFQNIPPPPASISAGDMEDDGTAAEQADVTGILQKIAAAKVHVW